MSFEDLTFEDFEKHEEMCEELGDKINGMCNYFRSTFAEVPCEKMGIEKYSCRVEVSFSTEKNYIYRNFEAKYLGNLLYAISCFNADIEGISDAEDDYECVYLIKWANGQAQAITFEYAKTEEGKSALKFADESNEDVFIMCIDDAMQTMMDICQNEKIEPLNQVLTPILSSNSHNAIKHTVIAWVVICLNMMLGTFAVLNYFDLR